MNRIYLEVILDMPKSESKFAPLKKEQEELWDRLALSVQAIKSKGGVIDLPSEIPDIEIIKNTQEDSSKLEKHGSHNQQTHAGRNHPRHGSGALAIHAALPQTLNRVSQKIDKEFKRTNNFAAANDLATAKTHIWSAGKSTTPKSAAPSVANARLSISNAARKLSSTDTSAAIRLADLSKELKSLYEGLIGPEGGI